MKEEPCKHVEGVDTGKRIRKNLLNIGVFIAEILILVLLGPWAVRFFLPLLVGWLIAQIANPLVRFLGDCNRAGDVHKAVVSGWSAAKML